MEQSEKVLNEILNSQLIFRFHVCWYTYLVNRSTMLLFNPTFKKYLEILCTHVKVFLSCIQSIYNVGK